MALMDVASEAKFTFGIGGDWTLFRVLSFQGTEEMSRLYQFTLELAMEGSESDDFMFEELVGEEACLKIEAQGEDRYVHGIVNEIESLGERGSFTIYRLSLVPSLWLLTLRTNSRIFQKKKVNEIIQKVLTDAGIPGDRFRFALTNNYLKREYCVQYNETDFSFISRLLEEEGIFYFFEHSRDRHILVMGDQAVAHKPIPGENEVMFHISDSLVPEEESIFNFRYLKRISTGKVTLTDYNFKKPNLNLQVSEKDEENDKLEHYEYPGEYIEKGEGQRRVRVRLHEKTTFKSVGEGRSFCPRLIPGYTYELVNHPRSTLNQEYTLTKVVHKGKQPQVLEEHSMLEELEYYNTFQCIEKIVVFKPRRITPKPIVPGTQTAVVVGPEGEESYLDDDHYGMVKVQFHWDREGQRNEHSSCWIRVAYPYAGEKHGIQFTPLIGDEVLVDFLEGDPDRPVIIGSLFKGDHKALVKGKDMTKSQFLTPYGHAFYLDDKMKEIKLNTKEGHTLMMNEYGEDSYTELRTPEGRMVNLCDKSKEGRKGIALWTPDFNSIVIYDPDNRIQAQTQDWHKITLQKASPNIEIIDGSKNHKIQVGPGAIKIFADTGTMTLQTKGGTLTVKAAGQKLHLEGAGGTVVIDSSGITVNAGSKPVVINGSIIKLNS